MIREQYVNKYNVNKSTILQCFWILFPSTLPTDFQEFSPAHIQ